MEKEKLRFEENQLLGLNRNSIIRRMIFSLFCFIAYYWSEHPKPVNLELFRLGSYPGDENSGWLFFLLGLLILAFSAVLLFIRHMSTKVTEKAIILDGLWSTRKVRIDLQGIIAARKIRLRPSILNRPVYNLHSRGKIRFYTHGNDAVEVTTRDGLIYRIGTQRPNEFIKALELPPSN